MLQQANLSLTLSKKKEDPLICEAMEEHKKLLRALRENQENKQKLFMPPDEDNYKYHGVRNLVIQYENGSLFKIDGQKETPFYKNNMLDGPLQNFFDKLNFHCEPIKDQINSLDRVSLLFLLIGFPAIFAFAIITGYLLPIFVPIIVVILFLIILAFVFFIDIWIYIGLL